MKLEIDVFKDTKDRVKTHVKEHKEAYIAGAVCLGVGLLAGGVISQRGGISQCIDSFKLQYKSPTNNTITTILVRRGHPGNMIRCLETGEVFASQGRAAAAMNLDPGNLSRHLQGQRPHINGYHFENLGEMI